VLGGLVASWQSPPNGRLELGTRPPLRMTQDAAVADRQTLATAAVQAAIDAAHASGGGVVRCPPGD
jgi:polygalacturonase